MIYVVKVSNSGQTPLQGVELKAVMPPQLKILTAKPPPAPGARETIDNQGQGATFTKIDGVTEARVLEYTIEVQALQPGDLRPRFELRTLGMDPATPMVNTVQTTVYDTNQPLPPPAP